ncbi:MAG: hypothetical protein E6Q66_01035 [Pedobacter sp.]|nr:MAG: hypothetical protein E6Q66_01035 [Pedobacter sp.]
MKKIKFQKKLSLNKETIAKLNDEQMDGAKGGLRWPSFVKPNGFPGIPRVPATNFYSQHCNTSQFTCPGSYIRCVA